MISSKVTTRDPLGVGENKISWTIQERIDKTASIMHYYLTISE